MGAGGHCRPPAHVTNQFLSLNPFVWRKTRCHSAVRVKLYTIE